MEAFVLIALVAIGLLLAELLLPTGGVLAALGAIGLVVGGVVALGSDSSEADFIGPALIALGVLAAVSFYFVTRKVIAAHSEAAASDGTGELVGALAEARSSVDPEGRVWIEGALWAARLAAGSDPVRVGDRVRVEAVDGLTLAVRLEPSPAETSKEGAG
jgi:membrane-bound serine protease (ClpP class)